MNIYTDLYSDEKNKYLITLDITKRRNLFIVTYTKNALPLGDTGLPIKTNKETRTLTTFDIVFNHYPTTDEITKRISLKAQRLEKQKNQQEIQLKKQQKKQEQQRQQRHNYYNREKYYDYHYDYDYY